MYSLYGGERDIHDVEEGRDIITRMGVMLMD
jgi:hypothetical protein